MVRPLAVDPFETHANRVMDMIQPRLDAVRYVGWVKWGRFGRWLAKVHGTDRDVVSRELDQVPVPAGVQHVFRTVMAVGETPRGKV